MAGKRIVIDFDNTMGVDGGFTLSTTERAYDICFR